MTHTPTSFFSEYLFDCPPPGRPLTLIGTKMVLIDIFKVPVAVSLGVVLGILAITMVWSAKTAPHT